MANKYKYIVTYSIRHGEEIFIFPSTINHDTMMESLKEFKNLIGDYDKICRIPISAGFTDGIRCWGRSQTLNLSSRPKDLEILTRQ